MPVLVRALRVRGRRGNKEGVAMNNDLLDLFNSWESSRGQIYETKVPLFLPSFFPLFLSSARQCAHMREWESQEGQRGDHERLLIGPVLIVGRALEDKYTPLSPLSLLSKLHVIVHSTQEERREEREERRRGKKAIEGE